MIAVRMAVGDNNWSKASSVELTAQDPSSMVPKSLRAMALKEVDAHKKLQASTTSVLALAEPRALLPTGDPHPQYSNNLYGKNKNKDGKGKGKGAGKNKKKW